MLSHVAKFDLSEIQQSAIRALSSTFLAYTAHDVVSCPSSDLSVCPIFFFPLASTIHPRALIEARTAGAGYREKKISSIRPSSGDLCTRCMIDTRWRCPDVARLVGRSAVQKARMREKRCATHGRTDRWADRRTESEMSSAAN